MEYLASLGVKAGMSRRSERLRRRLEGSYGLIRSHEHKLSHLFLSEALTIPGLTVYGITEVDDISRRTPTFSVSIRGDRYFCFYLMTE